MHGHDHHNRQERRDMRACFPTTAAMLILMTLLGGCTPVFRIQVNGFADPGYAGRLAPPASIAVEENARAENPLFEKEIKAKVNKLIKGKGFLIAAPDRADFLCNFSYGMGAGPTRIGSLAVPSPPLASAVVVSNQGGTVQTGTVMAPGPPTYVPYAWTEYDRWLNIVIRDARLFRSAKKDQVVWYGEVLSSGTSRDLRRIINYLLVAAFAEFGRDTKQGVIHELKEDDEQAASLMRE